MSKLIHYTNCPVCNSSSINEYFTGKDHSVTGDSFMLMKCSFCDLVFTQDVPMAEHMEPYYESEQYISHTDVKNDFVSRLYHTIRKITLRLKVRLVVNKTEKIVGHHLDIGAGTGAFVHAMEKTGWNSIGVEPSEAARKRANELYLASIYPMKELYNFSEGSYTAVTMWHVLEHVHHLHDIVEKAAFILDKEGKLFIAVPNYSSFDARYYKSFWAAYDLPRHLYHFSIRSMRHLMDQHGLVIEKVKPMWFDSFYVSMLSEKYKKGSLLRGMIIGAISNIFAIFNTSKCSSLLYIVRKK
jgi:2-polyprenyl-3-methyl-5-hydroxy-6-metoxy-1,4-benzoquinol methylase